MAPFYIKEFQVVYNYIQFISNGNGGPFLFGDLENMQTIHRRYDLIVIIISVTCQHSSLCLFDL